MALTTKTVEKLVRDATPGATADSGGLYLKIGPTGAPSWQFRYSFDGRRRAMGLGSIAVVSLAKARERAAEARRLVADRVDPIDRRKADESERRARTTTFDQAAEQFLATKLAEFRNEKNRAQWRSTLLEYASPAFGKKPVGEVGTDDVLRALRPIWSTKTETASRVRGRIEAVLSFAMQAGLRPQGMNPAQWKGVLDHQLPAASKVAKKKHHAALPFARMPAFIVALRAAGGLGARALELAIMTAARSGEVRGATWREFDLKSCTWTIPAERMKAGREHRVPLSPQAVALLRALPRRKSTELLFASSKDTQISDMTLTVAIRRMQEAETKAKRAGWTDPKEGDRVVTAHGFRSAFRDWAAEETEMPSNVIETALAHVEGNKSVAAYARSDLFEKRRRLMADWADFISPETPGKHADAGSVMF